MHQGSYGLKCGPLNEHADQASSAFGLVSGLRDAGKRGIGRRDLHIRALYQLHLVGLTDLSRRSRSSSVSNAVKK